eukprot:TCONS_00007768-protein
MLKILMVISLFINGVLSQNELTFTDTRKDKRFTAEVIATPSGTNGNPIKCLTHCLANKNKCKSINVNKELGKCELLGQSKLKDDDLEMKDEEGWIYYGPAQLLE